MKSLRTLLLAGAGLCLATVAMADLYIEYSTKSETVMMGQEPKKQDLTMKHWYKKDRIAQDDANGVSITRFDKQLIWRTETSSKTYTEVTFEGLKKQMEAAKAQMAAGRKQMEEALNNPNLPEAAKEAMKKSMAAMGAKYTVEKGDTEKVLDYTCTRWTVKANDEKMYEVWATEQLDPGVDPGRLHELTAGAQPGLAEEFKKIKGVWLKWEMETKAQGFSSKQTSVATKVSKSAIEDSVFDIPAGFNKKESGN